ncbi:MAG: glycosyltransferase family 39 protein [Candidatus Altiarchaeota archaeon]
MRFGWRILVVVVLALLLRSVNLQTVPVWDWDEGGNIEYARNIMEGRLEYFGRQYHFIAHPPLYFMLLAPLFKAFGATIMVLRSFSVVCSIVGLLLTYLIVRRVLDEDSALLAALIYAISPELIFWGRLGFANNLLAVLALASMYLLLRFLDSKDEKELLCAAALAGLCPITEYAGIVFPATLAIAVYWHAPKHLLKSLVVSAAPLTVFTAIMLAFDSEGFLKDAAWHFGIYPLAIPAVILGVLLFKRLSPMILRLFDRLYCGVGKETPAELVVFLLLTVWSIVPFELITFYSGIMPSAIFGISLIGIFLIPKSTFRDVLFASIASYGLILVTLNRWDHISIPLQHLVIFGSVFLIAKVKSYIRNQMPAYAMVLLILPLAATLLADVEGFALKGLCEIPQAEFAALNDFLNQRTSKDDIVVTYSYLAPGLKATPAVFEVVMPYNGYTFAYVKRTYAEDEVKQNQSIRNIRYAVLPWDFVHNSRKNGFWTNVTAELERWPLVYELNTTRKPSEGIASSLLGILGHPRSCESRYVVLENPRG